MSEVLGRMGKFLRTKAIYLNEKEIMLPMYYEHHEKSSLSCLFSKENKTDRFKEGECSVIPGEYSLQPSIVIWKNEIRAYTRARKGFVLTSTYDPGKKVWSEVKNTNVPNPNSAVDAVVTDKNEVLLVANAISGNRNELSLLISTDGVNFQKIFDFDKSEDSNNEYSYPAIIKTSDGFYQVTYTYLRRSIVHKRFNEDWLRQRIAEAFAKEAVH